MEDEELRKYIKTNWNAFLATCDLNQLVALREKFLDILIKIMPGLTHSEMRIGKKHKLERSFFEILADKHQV